MLSNLRASYRAQTTEYQRPREDTLMPSNEDLQNRARARELRKENRQKAVEMAHAEAQQASETQSENQAARKTEPVASNLTPKPKPKPVSRAETVRKEKAAHEVQARKDIEAVPAQVDVDSEFEKWDGRGAPPLHVLNALANKTDSEIRDEGKEIATAAGKAAYEVYTGKLAGKRNRYSRMRAQIAAGEAARAADQRKNEQQSG